MEETVESWLEITLAESDSQWEYWKALQLEQENMVFEWDGYFQSYLKKAYDINGCGLLLTGPDGCGKHTAARYMMFQLKEMDFAPVCLSGFLLETSSAGEAIVKLRGLLEDFYEKGKPLCLLVEELEVHPFRREILTFLGRKLREYYLNGDPAIFLILIDRDEKTIPHLLRNQLQLCRMFLPNTSQRENIIELYGQDINHRLSVGYFAEITEGLSCVQLRDLVATVCWMLDSCEIASSLSNDELREFCKKQMPQPDPEDAVPSIARSIQKLVETLPQAMRNLPVQANPTQPPTEQPMEQYNTERVNEKSYMSDERKRIKNLPPRKLAEETYGEKFVEEMLQDIH